MHAERERQHGLKVWQKTTTGQMTGGAQRLKELMKGTDVETTVVSKKTRQTRDLVTEAKTIIANDRRQEKENMAEFIAKKREMFLVQMSLDAPELGRLAAGGERLKRGSVCRVGGGRARLQPTEAAVAAVWREAASVAARPAQPRRHS